MINRRSLCKLSEETGLDYNNTDQIETALYNANFAINCLHDFKNESKDYLMKNLLISLKKIKNLLKSNSQIIKYKKDIIVLKSRLLELNLSEDIKNLNEDDLISFFETLNEICLLEMNASFKAKNDTLKVNEIRYKDDKHYYLSNKNDNIIVSRPSYIAARAKSGIKYGVCYVGNKVLNGMVKTLNKMKKK